MNPVRARPPLRRSTPALRRQATVAARQRGATLVVVLIFLVLMSLFAINAFLGSTTNLRIVGNMQSRSEAEAAAQVGIEQVISSPTFAKNPALAASVPLVVNNGSASYTVRITPLPSCYRVRVVKNSELDPNNPSDVSCIRSGTVQMPGVVQASPTLAGQLADTSLCADTEWDIRAEVSDGRSNALVAVHQGAAIRMIESDAINSCK